MHVEGGVDRNRGGARDLLHHFGVGERATGAVAQEQADEDDRVLGQRRGLLQHLLERAIGQLDRLEAVPIARGHPLELDRRGRRHTPSRDERDAARVRVEPQDELHVGAPVAIQPHPRDVGRKRQIGEHCLTCGNENQGNARKDGGAMEKGESKGGRPYRNDQGQVAGGVFRPQEVEHRARHLLVWEPREVERLGVEVDRGGGIRAER